MKDAIVTTGDDREAAERLDVLAEEIRAGLAAAEAGTFAEEAEVVEAFARFGG